jgi:hypothetical protein
MKKLRTLLFLSLPILTLIFGYTWGDGSITKAIRRARVLYDLSSYDDSRFFESVEEAHFDFIHQAKATSGVSRVYKIPDNGWWMPFVIYSQKATRDSYGNTWYGQDPYVVDINGDGLLDVMYSSYREPLYRRGGNIHGQLDQYINIGSPRGGFARVFSCTQRAYGSPGPIYYLYSGDCADTNHPNANNTDYVANPFTPGEPFAQNGVAPRGYSGITGLYQYAFQLDTNCWGRDQYGNWFVTRPNRCDQFLPEIMDLNGDGLPEVIMQGSYMKITKTPIRYDVFGNVISPLNAGQEYSATNAGLGFVLYNTGRGFVMR